MKNKVEIVVNGNEHVSKFKSLSINGVNVDNVKSYSIETGADGFNVVNITFYCDDVQINRDKNDTNKH